MQSEEEAEEKTPEAKAPIKTGGIYKRAKDI